MHNYHFWVVYAQKGRPVADRGLVNELSSAIVSLVLVPLALCYIYHPFSLLFWWLIDVFLLFSDALDK